MIIHRDIAYVLTSQTVYFHVEGEYTPAEKPTADSPGEESCFEFTSITAEGDITLCLQDRVLENLTTIMENVDKGPL